MDEHTAHGVLPVPLAGQRITIRRMKDGLRQGATRKLRPGVDGTVLVREAQTKQHTPFSMGEFRGTIEMHRLGSNCTNIFLLRDDFNVHFLFLQGKKLRMCSETSTGKRDYAWLRALKAAMAETASKAQAPGPSVLLHRC